VLQSSYFSLLNYLGTKYSVSSVAHAHVTFRFGIGGMMRSMSTLERVLKSAFMVPGILLYPSKMLYPGVLPLLSMFDALFEGGMAAWKKLRVFYIVFIM